MDSLKKQRLWTYSVIGAFFLAAVIIVAAAYADTGNTVSVPDVGEQALSENKPEPEPVMEPEETVSDNKEEEDDVKDDFEIFGLNNWISGGTT